MKKVANITHREVTVGLFVFIALLSFRAEYSLYHLPGEWIFSFLLLCTLFILYAKDKLMFTRNRYEAAIFGMAWLFVYLFNYVVNSGKQTMTSSLFLLYGVLFLLLSRNLQYKVIKWFAWCLSILLTLSLVEFIIFQTLHIGVILGNVIRETSVRSTYFTHLLFNLISYDLMIPRFQCLAEEPGLLGTLCGFMLYYTGRVERMRFPFYMFLFSGVISFSLAFYVIAFIYLVVNAFSIKKLLIISLLGGGLVYILQDRFETLILSRIVDRDIEEIDNRSSYSFDYYFNSAYRNGSLWLGLGYGNLPSDINFNASGTREVGTGGGKKWILQYGIICFMLLFVVYNILYLHRRGKMSLYDWIFLLVFWASYYQRQTIEKPYTLIAFFAVPLITMVDLNNNLGESKNKIKILE